MTQPSADARPSPAEDDECELCEAARWTHWYSEGEHGWVADCEVCQVPMVVWWRHGTEPPRAERQQMLDQLAAAADQRFGAGAWSLDEMMNQVPDHFHAHARNRGWREERFSSPMSVYGGVGGQRRTG